MKEIRFVYTFVGGYTIERTVSVKPDTISNLTLSILWWILIWLSLFFFFSSSSVCIKVMIIVILSSVMTTVCVCVYIYYYINFLLAIFFFSFFSIFFFIRFLLLSFSILFFWCWTLTSCYETRSHQTWNAVIWFSSTLVDFFFFFFCFPPLTFCSLSFSFFFLMHRLIEAQLLVYLLKYTRIIKKTKNKKRMKKWDRKMKINHSTFFFYFEQNEYICCCITRNIHGTMKI